MTEPLLPSRDTETLSFKEKSRLRVTAALWKRSVLDWKLEPQQLKAYHLIKKAAEKPNNRFVLNASRRWGKTFLLALLAVEFALLNPGSFILYAASSQKAVKEMLLPAFDALFADCPDNLRAVLKTQTNRYVFANGSKIKLTGLDGGRLQKLRGLTAHFIIVDEAGFLDDLTTAVRDVLFPMTMSTKGQMILSSNAPLRRSHHFIKIFAREAEAEGFYLKQTIFDVPKYTKEDIDRFAAAAGGYDSPTFRREYMCESLGDEENSVIPLFARFKDDVSPREETFPKRPEFFHSLVSIDLGFAVDYTGVVFGYWDYLNARGIIEDELLLKRANSLKLVKECREKEQKLWFNEQGEPPAKPIVRVGDGQAFTINDINTVHKYAVGMVSKDSVEAQANALVTDIQNAKILIHPRCVQLIGQIEDATWNAQRLEFKRDTTDGNGHYDLLAALLYWIRHINRFSNPYPPYYQLDTRNMVLKQSKLQNSSLQALQKLLAPKPL